METKSYIQYFENENFRLNYFLLLLNHVQKNQRYVPAIPRIRTR